MPYFQSSSCGCRRGPDFHLWIQKKLAQVVGPWVPQTGRISWATYHALRIFQAQNQLPATGILDRPTLAALRNNFLVTSLSSDFPELLMGRREEAEAEPELQVKSPGGCSIMVQWGAPIDLSSRLGRASIPNIPGIYAVTVNNPLDECWYVGKARNIHERFKDRWKIFRDFKLEAETDQILDQWLKDRKLHTAMIQYQGSIEVRRRESGRRSFPRTPMNTAEGLRAIVEQFYIKRYGTLNKGNRQPDWITQVTGSVTLSESGTPPCFAIKGSVPVTPS